MHGIWGKDERYWQHDEKEQEEERIKKLGISPLGIK